MISEVTAGQSLSIPHLISVLAEQIADLEALRARLGAEKMNLLGHSWGGLLAMAYAALHQERIEHLVLVDSSAPDWGRNPGTDLFDAVFPETGVRRKGLAFASELGDADAIAQDVDEYISMLFFDKGHLEKFRERVRAGETHYTYTHAVNKAVWNDLPRFDLTPELAKFRFPTLGITGRYDFNVPPSTAWSIHPAIPDSEFAVFESSGHMPFFEEQDAFSRDWRPSCLAPPQRGAADTPSAVSSQLTHCILRLSNRPRHLGVLRLRKP